MYIFMALLAITSQNLPFTVFLNPDSLDEESALCKILCLHRKTQTQKKSDINPHFVYFYRCSF
jgi:hypothetical protein